MKLTQYSQIRLYNSFQEYDVAKDFADPIFNYLVHGYSPGGFFTSLLANDCVGAISRSHPANTISALKNLTTWIVNEMPKESWGNYAVVNSWLETPPEERREILEKSRLIYPEKEEVVLILKGEKPTERIFF